MGVINGLLLCDYDPGIGSFHVNLFLVQAISVGYPSVGNCCVCLFKCIQENSLGVVRFSLADSRTVVVDFSDSQQRSEAPEKFGSEKCIVRAQPLWARPYI